MHRRPDQTTTIEVEFRRATASVCEHLPVAHSKEQRDQCANGKRAFHSPKESIAISGTAGPSNDRNSRKRRGYHARIWDIVPANIRPGSVYLSQHFPDSHLPGKGHEVILLDDRDHAGFLMRHLGEGAAKDRSWTTPSLTPCCWRPVRRCKSPRSERP